MKKLAKEILTIIAVMIILSGIGAAGLYYLFSEVLPGLKH